MLEPGDKAPDFELSDQNGNPVNLSDLIASDQTVVLLFLSPR
jgi:peroxiredoxin